MTARPSFQKRRIHPAIIKTIPIKTPFIELPILERNEVFVTTVVAILENHITKLFCERTYSVVVPSNSGPSFTASSQVARVIPSLWCGGA